MTIKKITYLQKTDFSNILERYKMNNINNLPPTHTNRHINQNLKNIFHNLNFFRLIFIYEIVCSHLALPLQFKCKYVGHTEYFFLLAGFLFFLNFHKETTLFNFLKKKVLSWYPLMIFGIFIRVCVIQKFNKFAFFSELLFFPLTGVGFLGINMPDWFLAVLFWVMAFYFLLFKAFNEQISNFLLFCAVVLSCLTFSIGKYEIINMQLVRGIMGVGLGIVAAKTYNAFLQEKNLFSGKFSKICITSLELFVSVSSIACRNWTFVIASQFFLIIFMALNKGYLSQLLNKELFTKASKYVLAIFLTHGTLVNEVLPRLINIYPDILVHKTIAKALTYILVVILGVVSFHIINYRKAKNSPRF